MSKGIVTPLFSFSGNGRGREGYARKWIQICSYQWSKMLELYLCLSWQESFRQIKKKIINKSTGIYVWERFGKFKEYQSGQNKQFINHTTVKLIFANFQKKFASISHRTFDIEVVKKLDNMWQHLTNIAGKHAGEQIWSYLWKRTRNLRNTKIRLASERYWTVQCPLSKI